MNAYQDFLDFFSMHNKERLDGLGMSYFSAMTQQERNRAYEYLLARIKSGGGEECVNGLFLANFERASADLAMLSEGDILGEEEKIVVAGYLFNAFGIEAVGPIFVAAMTSADSRLRELGARYAPAVQDAEVLACLEGMVRTETDRRLLVQAATSLMRCRQLNIRTIGKQSFLAINHGLLSDDSNAKERAIQSSRNLSRGIGVAPE